MGKSVLWGLCCPRGRCMFIGKALRTHLLQVNVGTKPPSRAPRTSPGHSGFSAGAAAQARCGAVKGGTPCLVSPDTRSLPSAATGIAVDASPLPQAEIAASFSQIELTDSTCPCKNNVDTLCRVCFSSQPPPFPEICGPIHCPGCHRKLLQTPLAQQCQERLRYFFAHPLILPPF